MRHRHARYERQMWLCAPFRAADDDYCSLSAPGSSVSGRIFTASVVIDVRPLHAAPPNGKRLLVRYVFARLRDAAVISLLRRW